MGIFKLNLLLNMQRQRRRRQIQSRNGSILIDSRGKMKGPPCQQDKHSQSGQAKCSGPTLPEDIWCHIHSLMSMRDAARVACVSRAFARSWRCLPNLKLTEQSLGIDENTCEKDKKMRDFTSKVDWILKNHSGIGVKKLEIHVAAVRGQENCFRLAQLDSWLQLAVKPGIEELIVVLSPMISIYNFPCELLSGGTGDSLRYIYLGACNFHPRVRIGCLKSLTRLQLCMVHITENELRCLLSNSLGLKWLELRYCSTIKCLKIPCLQRLSYLEVTSCTRLQVIQSQAPNLSSFRFAGDLCVQVSLGETVIKNLDMTCNNAAFYARTELPSSMPNLERLFIYSRCEMVNTPMVPSKFDHLKFLHIVFVGQSYDYLSLVSFFDASPFLETFILNALGRRIEPVSIYGDTSGLRMMPEHRHDKLKYVKIINFSSAKSLVELTCHIVESTTALECLTLDTTSGFPRCSVNKRGKCISLHTQALREAHRALKAVQTYIKLKVPSKVELNVLEPCSRCHAVDL